MEFLLDGEIVFSRQPDRAALESVIKNANSDLLVRGAGGGKGASVEHFSLEDNKLLLTIKSDRFVRAHDALLRLRKALAEELGKKLKVGVRGVGISEYSISLGIAGDEKLAQTLGKLPLVSEAIAGADLTIKIKNPPQSALEDNSIDRLVTLVLNIADQQNAPPQAEKVVLIKQSPQKEMLLQKDPAEVAKELGWIKEFPGRGQWIYLEPYTRVLMAIERMILDKVAAPLGFNEVMLPKLIPFDVEKNMPGYFSKMPAHMYYVCPPPVEAGDLDLFRYSYELTKEPDPEELKKHLRSPSYVLAPSQCEPSYELYRGEIFSEEELPVKFFDKSGFTYRWEGGGTEGIVRTQEFRRIEFVYFGYPKQVVEIRDAILERALDAVEKILDLEWRVVVGIPWYSAGDLGTEDFKDSMKVPTYDIEAYMPYRGPREGSEWLEIFSGNNNKDKFIKSFHIKESKGREFWSGCTGFGITRWVAAFLAQKGFNPDNWPSEFKKYSGDIPGVSRCMTWPRRA